MKKEEQPQPGVEEVLAPIRERFVRSSATTIAVGVVVAMSLLIIATRTWGLGEATGYMVAMPTSIVMALLSFLTFGLFLQGKEQSRLRGARALMKEGHLEEAQVYLKRLARPSKNKSKRPRRIHEEASYLVARCYELQGARKLAEAYYREYLEKYPTGSWKVEVQLKLEELSKPAPALATRVKENVELRCPFCKDGFTGAEQVRECQGCGTAQHEACFEEHGGCALLGCQAAPAPRQRA